MHALFTRARAEAWRAALPKQRPCAPAHRRAETAFLAAGLALLGLLHLLH